MQDVDAAGRGSMDEWVQSLLDAVHAQRAAAVHRFGRCRRGKHSSHASQSPRHPEPTSAWLCAASRPSSPPSAAPFPRRILLFSHQSLAMAMAMAALSRPTALAAASCKPRQASAAGWRPLRGAWEVPWAAPARKPTGRLAGRIAGRPLSAESRPAARLAAAAALNTLLPALLTPAALHRCRCRPQRSAAHRAGGSSHCCGELRLP